MYATDGRTDKNNAYYASLGPLPYGRGRNNTGRMLENAAFFRTILCINAADAVARCPSVCSSVRRSDTFVYSVETSKHIFIFFTTV